MPLYGSTFPRRDVIEAWLKIDVLRASRVGIHRELGDVDRALAYAAGLVPAVLPEPERRTRAATDTARALLAVGDVLPSRAGRSAEQMAGFPDLGYSVSGAISPYPLSC
ncbi:hypothetical protein PV408_31315 [Streptomyces sp. ME18-1-4]|nr:hypothetical protein [Streptomyces sp. ME18-1-4]